ncbi:MAG: helix-turn-helix domain-containing protein [Firmicutes bacterium]|nr:helix-turn-helix domain-containing protein [Bacillota bacterium]
MEKIIPRIKELREEKGLTQAQLAKAIGFNYRTISQYERGINEPDLKTIKKLCDFFEVTSDYLLGFEDL